MWYVNVSVLFGEDMQNKTFILTMWYVNIDIDAANAYDTIVFYINYVICK